MKKIFFLALFLCPLALSSQTITYNSSVTTQTMRDSVAGIVYNCDYYDSICLKNMVVIDPGFQPLLYDSLIQVSSGGTTTAFTDANVFALHTSAIVGASYTDFRNSAGIWTAVCSGTISTASGTGLTTTFCGASGGFSVGDFVEVKQNFIPTTQAQWPYLGVGVSVSGAGTVVGETTDLSTVGLPLGTAKSQSVRVDTSGGGTAAISFNNDTGHKGTPSQNQVSVTSSINISITANVTSGTGTENWQIQRVGGFSCTGSFSLTTTPTLFTASSCTPSETGASPVGNIIVTLSNVGNEQVDIHQIAVTLPTIQTTGLSDPVLTDLNGFATRVLDGNQLPSTLTNLLQPDTRGVQPISYVENCGGGNPEWQCVTPAPITIPMALAVQAASGRSLWYDVPPNLNATDGATLAQFINGSVGTTGGAIRNAQGHSLGYLSNFLNGATLTIEFCNECWNTPAGDKIGYVSALGANEYVPYCSAVNTFFTGFTGDPAYNSTTEQTAINGQTSGGSAVFALDPCIKSGTGFISPSTVTTIAQAPYTIYGITTGGMDTAAPITTQQKAAYANVYANANIGTQPLAYIVNNAYPQKIGIYEQNNGYNGFNVSGGFPTQAMLDGWSEGIAYAHVNGIQILESCSVLGICSPQNEFTYEQYQKQFSSGPTLSNKIWGIKIGAGAQSNNNPRPTFQELQLLNQYIPPQATMIGKTITANLTYAFTGVDQVPSIASMPLIFAYGFKKGTARTYIIYNTDTSSHFVNLAGIDAVGTLTQVVLGSTNATDNNESSLVVAPVTTTGVAVPSSYTAPANSMTIFQGSTTVGLGVTLGGHITIGGHVTIP
jgi:hypothetical protein